MQPTVTDVHIDAILTQMSVAYMQSRSNFIANQVFPQLPVDKKSDLYYIYTKGDWFRDEAQRRAPGVESAGSGYGLSTGRYECNVYAMHKDIDSQTRANADSVLNLDRDATEFVTGRLLLKQEKVWVAKYFTPTAGWATTLDGDASGFDQWDDYVNSDPIADVETAKATILSTTGMLPNTLTMGFKVYQKIRNHPDIIERIKYTSQVTGKTVNANMLAQMFDVDRVLVAMAVENTAQEGATDSFAFTHGDHVLLTYSPPSPGLMTPSAGYTFMWRGVSAGLGENVGISRWFNQDRKSDRVEGEIAFDYKQIGTDLGYMLANAIS